MSGQTKIPGIPPPDHGPGGAHQTAHRQWLLVALALVVTALGAAGVLAGRWPGLAERVAAGLPSPPDLKGKPAVLAELLSKAQAMTKTHRDTLAGVAELGRLYHANGYRHEAEACWQLLQAEQPREAQWLYYLADLRRAASDYPAMGALLEQTVKLAPDYAPAWLHLAELQFKTGQLESAERNYGRRLALLPADPYARLGLARVALQNGRRDEARHRLEELIKDTPEFPPGHNLYAELLAGDGDIPGAGRQRFLGRETGRFREADDPWMDGMQAWCYDYARLCVLGTIEYQTAHGDWGKSFFERAIALRPDDPSGYEFLGSLHQKRNDPAKARDTLEQGLLKAKTLRPSVLFYVNLSRAYRDLKQPAEAVRIARQGLRQLGDAFELHDALGAALGDWGHPEEAVEALRTAVALNPNDSNANYNLAVALLALRRLDEALVALNRSLVLQPTFPNSLLLLGRVEMDSGRWEAAEKYLRPLYESHPEMPDARRLMAQWHWRAGRAAEANKDLVAAEHHYQEGLTVEPNHAELQAGLGTLYLIQGRFADAIRPLEAFHRLQPGNPQSSLFLGQAYAAMGQRDEARRILTEGVQIAERSGNSTTAQHCRDILQQL